MKLLRKIFRKIIKNRKTLIYTNIIYKYLRSSKSIVSTGIFAIICFVRKYIPNRKLSKGKQLKNLFTKEKIKINKEGFIYIIDPYKMAYYNNRIIDNVTIDYNIILNTSLEEFIKKNKQMSKSDYKENQYELLEGIEILVNRIIKKLSKSDKVDKEKFIHYFENIKNGKAKTFEEALQRILFYNQLLWQTGHALNGLGRLDKILDKYYQLDISNNVCTKESASELINEFMKKLHQDYWLKSNSLLGDTGQIIILGGKEENGDYFCNELTYMFINEINKLQLPDPKVLLRVSNNMPRDLLETALNCIKTGIGCPLLSNDDVIIEKLIEFGYEKKSTYNYGTSACWEPLIIGESLEQNNIKSFVFIKPFIQMLNEEDLNTINSIKDLMQKYKYYLEKYTNDFCDELDGIEYEKDPIMSLFVENCNETLTDISKGGAKYNNYGITSVSLANTVNSILNINEFVFEKNKFTLKELNEIRQNNFNGKDDILKLLKQQNMRYGKDNEYVLSYANEITSWVNEIFKNKKNKYGGHIKFGLSAPTYIDESKEIDASLDGRKKGDPFIVHISSDVVSLPYTELIQFAAKLDYSGNRFNGNVIDFMVTPSFIENNFEKFIDFIILSIDIGFFQMQMNVISSDILIKARENPKEFPNLIVRVWGFSSYFNDLPEEYKNVLIERALKNEGKNN